MSMTIGLKDIDPAIASRIRAMLDSMRAIGFEHEHHPHTPERDAQLAARDVLQRRDKVPHVARLAIGIVVGVTSLLLCAGGINSGTIPGPFVLSGPVLGGLSYWFSWWVNKQGTVDDLDNSMKCEEVRAARSVIQVTTAEATYLESVALLLELKQLDSQTGKDILSELNTLMVQSHQLDEHRSNLRASINAASLDELTTRQEELRARLAATKDEAARKAIEQSIELLDSRLRVAQTLQPGLDRVEAQQEVIQLTLASVQSALARMKVAPAELSAPDFAIIQQSISEVTGQTRAVEDAVQEVMSIRAD